jgi:hypothetical protein
MPKASVDITSASREEIEALLLEFGLEGLSEFTKCYGGFSGSNYACTLTDGRRLLLKCTNDQPRSDVEAQVATLLFMRQAGATAPPTCYPWPLAGDDAAGYLTMTTGSPSIILDFLDGGPADKALLKAGPSITSRLFGGAVTALLSRFRLPCWTTPHERHPLPACLAWPVRLPVLTHCLAAASARRTMQGSALAKLHKVPLGSAEEMAAIGIRDAGGPGRYPGQDPAACCFVGHQPGLVESFKSEACIEGHPFLPLHAEQVPALVETMQADVPRGLLHGDPFLDNLLSTDEGAHTLPHNKTKARTETE